eukprot:53941-Amphidinium_carterae.1
MNRTSTAKRFPTGVSQKQMNHWEPASWFWASSVTSNNALGSIAFTLSRNDRLAMAPEMTTSPTCSFESAVYQLRFFVE